MSTIEALKKACTKSSQFRKFDDIDFGVYDIEEFKFVTTKFGKKLVVRTAEFLCFLPERCSTTINTDEQLEDLNNGLWAMQYKGKDAKRGNYIMVEIIERQPQLEDLDMDELITSDIENDEQQDDEDEPSKNNIQPEKDEGQSSKNTRSKKRKLQ